MLIRSPISSEASEKTATKAVYDIHGFWTRMNKRPSKYFELADPIMKAKASMMLLKLRNIWKGLNPRIESTMENSVT